MFQPKARRIVPVLALAATLSLVPLTDASAASRAARSKPKAKPAGTSLLVQLEVQLGSLWGALQAIWADAGVRMDDNG